MQIINPQVLHDLQKGVPLQINLGSGGVHIPGFYGVDLLPLEGVDVQADLNQPLEFFSDNSVSHVISRHTFEHVSNLLGLLEELHRVVRADGRIEFVVPHFSDPAGYSDPTHVRFFGLFSMLYFADEHRWHRRVPNFYSKTRFIIDDTRILFRRTGLDAFLGRAKEWVANLHPHAQQIYERHWCWIFPACEMKYVFHPKK